jgi:hypothetical protein
MQFPTKHLFLIQCRAVWQHPTVLGKKLMPNFNTSKLQCRVKKQKKTQRDEHQQISLCCPLVRVQFSSRKFNPTTDAFFFHTHT